MERNKLLHLAILVLGGSYTILLNGALSKSDVIQEIPSKVLTITIFCLAVPLLVFITAITKARLIRKYQIADRWEVLDSMISNMKGLVALSDSNAIEHKVVAGLRKNRYVSEDKAVFIGLSVFIYSPLITFFICLWYYFSRYCPVIIASCICCLHFFFSWWWLFRRPLLSGKGKKNASENSSKENTE